MRHTKFCFVLSQLSHLDTHTLPISPYLLFSFLLLSLPFSVLLSSFLLSESPSLPPTLPPYLSFLSRFSSLSLALVCSLKMTASFPFCLCFNFLWPSPIPTLLLADNLLHFVLWSLPVQPLQNKVHGCVMLFVCCG